MERINHDIVGEDKNRIRDNYATKGFVNVYFTDLYLVLQGHRPTS